MQLRHSSGVKRVKAFRMASQRSDADALQATSEAQGLGSGHREALDDAQGAHRSRASADDHHARDAAAGHRV